MRILLDECVPRRLPKELLPEHQVRTVPEQGWTSLENGTLIATASAHFDVFITTDKRLTFQQNVVKLPLSVITLVARRNKLEFLLPLVPELRKTLAEIGNCQSRRIGE